MFARRLDALIVCIAVLSLAGVAQAARSTSSGQASKGSGEAYPDQADTPDRSVRAGRHQRHPGAHGGDAPQPDLGQPVIVDNRAGAEGIIGTDLAAKARPDGYTLIVVSSAYTMNPAVMKLPYDPLTALEFVAKIGTSFLVLSVGPALRQVNSVKDLIAAAKAKPGQIVLSSSGGFLHFATRALHEPVEGEIQHRSLQGRVPGHDGRHRGADPRSLPGERAGAAAPAFGQAQGSRGRQPDAGRAAARPADARRGGDQGLRVRRTGTPSRPRPARRGRS